MRFPGMQEFARGSENFMPVEDDETFGTFGKMHNQRRLAGVKAKLTIRGAPLSSFWNTLAAEKNEFFLSVLRSDFTLQR